MITAATPLAENGLRHWAAGRGVRVVAVTGEFDLNGAPALRELLVRLVDVGVRRMIIDLGDALFIDSTVIGVLAGQLKRLRAAGGSMVLACPAGNVLRTIEISGMARAFDVEETLPDALGRVA
jgi:anti-sigma B factor antagonist